MTSHLYVAVAPAPTNLTAVQEDLTSIRVSWSLPTKTLKEIATGYIITYSEGGSSDSVNVGGGFTDNYLLTGLVMKSTYTISLMATSHALFPSESVQTKITLCKILKKYYS